MAMWDKREKGRKVMGRRMLSLMGRPTISEKTLCFPRLYPVQYAKMVSPAELYPLTPKYPQFIIII
jgi:hypothetical protein